MRIECPACRARYEVADSAIPAAGRTVQCGACGHTWFHKPEAAQAEPPRLPPDAEDWDAEFEDMPAEAGEPEPSPAYRTLYRKKPDALLTDPEEPEADETVVRPGPEAPRPETPVFSPAALRAAIEDGQKVAPLRAVPAPAPAPVEPESSGDAAALASLLTRNRAARDSRLAPAPLPVPETGPSLVPGMASEAPVPAPGRSRFATGLALVLLLFLAMLAAYALRAPLAEAVPEAEPWLAAYAAQVDAARAAVQALWARALATVAG